MGRPTITHLVIAQCVGLSAIAWASSTFARDRDSGSGGYASSPNEFRNKAVIDLRGKLNCPLPVTNTGGACSLAIVSGTTGESFRVSGSETAMRLFQSGQTQVVARGNILGDSFRIIEIYAE